MVYFYKQLYYSKIVLIYIKIVKKKNKESTIYLEEKRKKKEIANLSRRIFKIRNW